MLQPESTPSSRCTAESKPKSEEAAKNMIRGRMLSKILNQHLKEATPSKDSNLAISKKHVPEAERNYCTYKSKCIQHVKACPFSTKILIIHLGGEAAEKLNLFPAITVIETVTHLAKADSTWQRLIIKTLTMTTLRNKTLILKQMINFKG